MKKVMMIAYHYPPKLSVGRLRTIEFEKYLPQFGWLPIIHTTKEKNSIIKANVYRSYDIKLNKLSDFFDVEPKIIVLALSELKKEGLII